MSRKSCLALSLLAILLLAACFALFSAFFPIFVRKNLVLRPDSRALHRFQTPFDVRTRVHFFEPKNVSDWSALAMDVSPAFHVLQRRSRTRLNFSRDLSSLSFEATRVFSVPRDFPRAHVHVVNLPLLAVALNRALPSARAAFDSLRSLLPEQEIQLFRSFAAEELLFSGVEVLLHRLLRPFVRKDSGIALKERFALFGHVTADHVTLGSGIGEKPSFGQISEFEGKKSLTNSDQSETSVWPTDQSDHCNRVQGTDGTFFAPPVTREHVLHVFEPSLCRSLSFVFSEETEVKGIPVFRFRPQNHVFWSPAKHAPNTCYCLHANTSACVDGLLDVSRCWRVSGGAPLLMSLPYFMSGPSRLRTEVGLRPEVPLDEEHVGSFLDVEPVSGLVLRAIKRLQLNVLVTRVPGITETEELNKSLVVPLLWLEEAAEADHAAARELRRVLWWPRGARWTSGALLCLAMMIFVLFFGFV